ncbi:core-2/I-branching enzyme-domain-containing protein [Fimicolochytrium jonesii]|uniref:core-2/I-branching enzyme-domain-containing protein n=1 Tax=Fimicolochytrium jonesii TaxID=1396493 RepID=UPI0022FEB2FB|nr:core-2/I-branching enzyme-domain-containing protein [Fimicolochytrium jonesii]KAI8821838.1 core-2/I-branching enzyme-domain-containing protein [Fimicolochytrium jonesii]
MDSPRADRNRDDPAAKGGHSVLFAPRRSHHGRRNTGGVGKGIISGSGAGGGALAYLKKLGRPGCLRYVFFALLVCFVTYTILLSSDSASQSLESTKNAAHGFLSRKHRFKLHHQDPTIPDQEDESVNYDESSEVPVAVGSDSDAAAPDDPSNSNTENKATSPESEDQSENKQTPMSSITGENMNATEVANAIADNEPGAHNARLPAAMLPNKGGEDNAVAQAQQAAPAPDSDASRRPASPGADKKQSQSPTGNKKDDIAWYKAQYEALKRRMALEMENAVQADRERRKEELETLVESKLTQRIANERAEMEKEFKKKLTHEIEHVKGDARDTVTSELDKIFATANVNQLNQRIFHPDLANRLSRTKLVELTGFKMCEMLDGALFNPWVNLLPIGGSLVTANPSRALATGMLDALARKIFDNINSWADDDKFDKDSVTRFACYMAAHGRNEYGLMTDGAWLVHINGSKYFQDLVLEGPGDTPLHPGVRYLGVEGERKIAEEKQRKEKEDAEGNHEKKKEHPQDPNNEHKSDDKKDDKEEQNNQHDDGHRNNDDKARRELAGDSGENKQAETNKEQPKPDDLTRFDLQIPTLGSDVTKDPSSPQVPRHKYKIAYLLLVHERLDIFETLFAALYNTDGVFLIHVDSKRVDFKRKVREWLIRHPIYKDARNIFLGRSFNLNWGASSIVFGQLQGFFSLMDVADWDYVVNLSGYDYPIRSSKSIHAILERDPGKVYIEHWQDPDTEWRMERAFFLAESKTYVKTPTAAPDRRFALDHRFRPMKHHQWMILPRDFISYLRKSQDAHDLLAWQEHSWIPDESYFAMVALSPKSGYADKIINDCKRFIFFDKGALHPIWIRDGDEHKLEKGANVEVSLPPEKRDNATNPTREYFFVRKINSLWEKKISGWMDDKRRKTDEALAQEIEEIDKRFWKNPDETGDYSVY